MSHGAEGMLAVMVGESHNRATFALFRGILPSQYR
jgi:hypothetical protein